MPHPKFIFLPLIISLLTAICPIQAQSDGGAWLSNISLQDGKVEVPTTVDSVKVDGTMMAISTTDGRRALALSPGLHLLKSGKNTQLYHVSDSPGNGPNKLRRIPLWLSILPPLIAIGLALIFKEVRT